MFPRNLHNVAAKGRRLLVTTSVVMLLWGCGASEDFSGRWRTTNGQESVEALNNAAAVELRLGHFGGSVAGTVSPYADTHFALPMFDCPCIYLQSGQATGDVMSFVLETDACPTLGMSGQLIVELDRVGDNEISGTITQLDSKKAEVAVSQVSLIRATDGSQTVLPFERGCALPAGTPQPDTSSSVDAAGSGDAQ